MKKYLCALVITAFISLNAFSQVEIDNAKNVGIGIATPTQKLDVNGQLRVRTIPLNNALNEVLVRDANGVVHYRGLETISYWTKSGTLLFSDSACFVGIGTSSPVQPLHVAGALRVEGDHHGHVTILKGPQQGLGGMTIEAKDELRLSSFDSTGSFRTTTVRINPPDTTTEASFDSFFDIFTELGECRYRAGRIDTGGLSGTGILLSDRHQISGLSSGAGGGGRISLRPDVTQTNGGGTLTVSNIGSSGCDGVSMVFNSDTASGSIVWRGFGNDPDDLCTVSIRPSTDPNTGQLVVSNIGSSGLDGVRIRFDADTTSGSITYRGFDPDPDNNCVIVMSPSTDTTKSNLVVSNLGSSGLDGVRVALGNSRIDGDHSADPGGGGGGGRVIITPDKRITNGGILKVSNLGSSGQDGVSIDLGEDVRIEGRDELAGGGGGGGRIAFIFDDASTDQRMVVSNIGSSGQDGVGFSDEAGQFWFEKLLPGVHNPNGGALRLTPSKLPSATGDDHLVVSNIGSSGLDGVRIDTEHELRLGVLDTFPSAVGATTVVLIPTDTSRQASFDSFFDIFTDAGECRYRAGRIDTNGFIGTGVLLHDAHRISGVKGGGGSGGAIWLEADVTQPNGGSKLKVSNLGSSGCDGVSISNPRPIPIEIVSLELVSTDPIGVLGPRVRMHTSIGDLSVGNTGSADSTGISLMDESSGNTGGHINFLPQSVCLFPGNGLYASVMARNNAGGTALGVRMTLDRNTTALEPAMDFNLDGSLDMVVRKSGGNNGQLRFSNIGSSGEDGVRMALSSGTATTVPIEIVALQLKSTGPVDVVSLDNNVLEWAWSMESTDQRLTRTVKDNTPGSTADPYIFVYDGNNNVLRETGPPTKLFDFDSLTTTYTYDHISRVTRVIRADGSSGSLADSHVYEYDANNNRVRETGPPETEYEHSGLLRRYFYDSTPGVRRVTLTHQDLDNPTSVPLLTEYDHSLNQIIFSAPSVHVNGTFTALVKNFTIDHPLDPYNKYLRHVSVESPDMMNIYNGNVKTDEKGYATVTMPDYFASLNMDFRYQLTAMGVFSQAIVKEKLADNKFVIQTDKPNVEVSWQVTGIRQDTYANENRIQVEADKSESMKGKLLYEPKKELGLNK